MVDKLDTFAERLKYLRKKNGLSLAAVARQIGVSPQAVHKWENGGKVDNDREWALADLFKVDAYWLIRGESSEQNLPELKRPRHHFVFGAPTLPQSSESGVYVPLLDSSEVVGWLDDAESVNWDYHKGQWIACPVEHGDRTFAMMVKGVTMENLGAKVSYSEGDIIFADPDAAYRSGSRVIFSAAGMARSLDVLFRQLIIEGGVNYWRTLNPQWPQAITPVSESHILLATVIGKWVSEE